MQTRRHVAKFEVETEMPEFDVEEFVAKMDRLGLKLTAVPLADGKYRVNRWRMSEAVENAEQIRNLWTSQIGDNQSRIDQLAAHLSQAEPRVIANRIFPGLHKAK
jgi:beta-xylosidase